MLPGSALELSPATIANPYIGPWLLWLLVAGLVRLIGSWLIDTRLTDQWPIFALETLPQPMASFQNDPMTSQRLPSLPGCSFTRTGAHDAAGRFAFCSAWQRAYLANLATPPSAPQKGQPLGMCTPTPQSLRVLTGFSRFASRTLAAARFEGILPKRWM